MIMPPTVQPDSATGTSLGANLGAQKDRRIYVGNLPIGITEDMIKEFCKLY